MVASHALHTAFVPQRMVGSCERYVAKRAGLDTTAASHTFIVGLEITWIDEEAVEERSYDVALDPRHRTRKSVENATAVDDVVYDLTHTCRHCVEFALLFGHGVDIKSGQANIRFGHLDCISKFASPALPSRDVAEYLGCHACIVAAGSYEVEVVYVAHLHLADELLDEWWYAPSVGGKHKAKSLAILQGVEHFGVEFVGDETHGVVEFVGKKLRHPLAVACS